MEKSVSVIDWSANPSDLNPIENLKGYLVLQFYKHFKQFETKKELRRAIREAWSNISQKVVNIWFCRCQSGV